MLSPELKALQERLGYTFQRPDLLIEALTHKSYLHESRERAVSDNERLEFLGDAVLDLVVSEELILRHPEATEGILSKMKSRLVSEPSLAAVAGGLDLGGSLFLGKGEELTHGRRKASLLADAFEALVAAVYLDGGYTRSREVILKHFSAMLADLKGTEGRADFKTDLQEYCQRFVGELPVYRTVGESGPDHRKIFDVEIEIRGEKMGEGSGHSKKEAEQAAARKALMRLQAEEGKRWERRGRDGERA